MIKILFLRCKNKTIICNYGYSLKKKCIAIHFTGKIQHEVANLWQESGKAPCIAGFPLHAVHDRDICNPLSDNFISTNLALGLGWTLERVSRIRVAACGSLATM